MSAGIIVMNKNAIAMAADSAVTIGNHAAIHNSANKLFALSTFEPIGAIIYSNSQFMQIPMEIIIKQYKMELKNTYFATLKEYVDSFLLFLTKNSVLFHFDINEEAYVIGLCCEVLNDLTKDFLKKAKETINRNNLPLTNDEESKIAKEVFDKKKLFLESQPVVRDDFSSYVRDKYFKIIISRIGNLASWVPDKESLATKICRLFDTNYSRLGYVGMAIAGYGKEEIFPHMVHLKLSGMINNKLRYEIIGKDDISEENTASITPLAQTDVIRTFIQGYNDIILENLEECVSVAVSKRLNKIPKSVLDETNKRIVSDSMNNIQKDISQQIRNESLSVFVRPIIESVTSLPIEELSLFAESMINITSVRRRVAIDGNIGTVGGPIDVATVTRGDGFIWLKRKFYFEAKRNPQFLYSRYGHPNMEIIEDDNK